MFRVQLAINTWQQGLETSVLLREVEVPSKTHARLMAEELTTLFPAVEFTNYEPDMIWESSPLPVSHDDARLFSSTHNFQQVGVYILERP